jgi:predicted lipoprotein with Yx(FWY)xxD motif
MRTLRRPRTALLGALAAAAIFVVAGCGSGSDTTGSSGGGGSLYGSGGGGSSTTSGYGAGAGTSGAAGGGGGVAVVSVANNPKLGKILVNSKGFTLYDFHKDKGTKSACSGACAKVWPPLTGSGTPTAKGGAEASKLGTTKRSDGTMQVTYAGHPLYTYVSDKQPGDVTGNDFTSFGGEWYALTPSGAEPKD